MPLCLLQQCKHGLRGKSAAVDSCQATASLCSHVRSCRPPYTLQCAGGSRQCFVATTFHLHIVDAASTPALLPV